MHYLYYYECLDNDSRKHNNYSRDTSHHVSLPQGERFFIDTALIVPTDIAPSSSCWPRLRAACR